MPNDWIDYYTLEHPDWSHARLVNHEAWDPSAGHTIGTWEHSFIKIPEEPRAHTLYLANLFHHENRRYIVKLNGSPLSSEDLYDWPSLNCEHIKTNLIFKFGDYRVYHRIKQQDDPLITLIHPDLEGEYIIDTDNYNGDYGLTLGSSPECYITLPDPKLLPFIGHIKSLGHHRVIYPLNGSPPYKGHARRNAKYYEHRIDNGPFHFWGYLIFQRRDVTSSHQAYWSTHFREANKMYIGAPPEKAQMGEDLNDPYDRDILETK